MARFGRWCPIAGQAPVRRTGGPCKVVHHKTVTKATTNYPALYRGSGAPHWTVGPVEVAQHFDTEVGSRALRNEPGGVETNSLDSLQIEVLGYPGQEMDDPTLNNLVALLRWIRADQGVVWDWPNGRPRGAINGRDSGGHNRDAGTWRSRSGHYAHSQIPENTHWDPAYTDREWFILNALLAPEATQAIVAVMKVPPVFQPALPVVHYVNTPEGDGAWLLLADGAVHTMGKAPYHGGANTKQYFVGRSAARIAPAGDEAMDGYVITATSGETYQYPGE